MSIQNGLTFKKIILHKEFGTLVYINLRETLGPELGVPDLWLSTGCFGPLLLSDADTNVTSPHL